MRNNCSNHNKKCPKGHYINNLGRFNALGIESHLKILPQSLIGGGGLRKQDGGGLTVVDYRS